MNTPTTLVIYGPYDPDQYEMPRCMVRRIGKYRAQDKPCRRIAKYAVKYPDGRFVYRCAYHNETLSNVPPPNTVIEWRNPE